MINIDYEIERDEGNETVLYKPDKLPKEYSNLVYIKAPNSTGKSTLLNLIALGFYGNKLSESELKNSLKRKIDNLLDINHQKVTFDISVDNPKLGWNLISTKSNPNSTDISVRLKRDGKEKQLSSETFFKDFRLIYDIPYNPLERLPQLLLEVKNAQVDVGQKIKLFRQRLRYLISEVRASRDLKELEELKETLKDLEGSKKKTERKFRLLNNHENKLKEYYYSKTYIETLRELKDHKNRLGELEEELGQSKKEDRVSARKIDNLNNKIYDQKNKTLYLYNRLYISLLQMLPKEEKDHLKSWKDSNIISEFSEPNLFKNIRNKNKYFINIFSITLENEKQIFSDDLDKILLYKKLLSTLSDIRFNDFKLPGVDQTVESFKELINDELKKYDSLETRLINLEQIISQIKDFNTSLNNTIKLYGQLKKINKECSPSTGRDIQSINDDIWATKDIIKKLDDKASRFRTNLVTYSFDPSKSLVRYENLSKDDDLRRFNFLSEEKIREELSKAQADLATTHNQIKKNDDLIDEQKDKIEKMEIKKPHEYRENLNQLDELSVIATRLQQRFVSKYSSFINDVIEGKDLDDDERKFAKYLGEFLASKIKLIKHIDNEYKVVNIDLMDRAIITEEEKEIRFDDIGTGQSQAAFLQGKLAMKDERKIIALLDEVAMMDEMTLEPIKNRLRNLYEGKKLFMAIIVQKSEKVEIEDLI